MSYIVENPFQVYTDLNGNPLDNGYVYLGLPNQDPITNPISVYWDSEATIPAAQPLRTLNGYLVNAGSPAIAYTADNEYSLLVTNAGGVTIFSAPSVSPAGGGGAGGGSGVVNVLQYGAVGDGSTNNDAAFEAAIAAAKASTHKLLYIPGGRYILAQTHDITELGVFGDARPFGENKGTSLVCTANLPMFATTSVIGNQKPTLLQNLSFTGANNASFTNNVAYQIRDTNHIRVLNCDFFYFYDAIRQFGTCFYAEYRDLRFWYQNNTCFNGMGDAGPGFDAHFANIIVNSITGNYGFKFTYAGSVTMDGVIMTPNGTVQAAVFFDSDAPLSGVHQLSNCVFELGGMGVYLKGTSTQRIKYVMMSNCYIASSSTTPALRIDYGHAQISTSYLTGSGYGIRVYGVCDVIMFGCEFQVLDVPISADNAATSVVFALSMCNYAGGYPFVYLPNLALSAVPRIDVVGGNVGVNATPVQVPDGTPGVRWAAGVPITTTSGVSAFNTRTGAVTLLPADVATALSSASAAVSSSATVRVTGHTNPTSGKGLELLYDTPTDAGYVSAYDRTTNAPKNLNLDGLSVAFKSGAALVDNNGYMLIGYAASQGAFRLQVNGGALFNNAVYGPAISPSATGLQLATLDYVIAKSTGGGAGSDFASTVRSTAQSNPVSGTGVEISYSTGLNGGYITAFDRSATAYKDMTVSGLNVYMQSSGTARVRLDTNGYFMVGSVTSQGAYAFQVTGDSIFTGSLFAPTPATATTGTRLATCDYVIARIASGGGGSGVTSFNGRTGAVTQTSGDITGALGYTPASTASPSFTGLESSAGGIQIGGRATPATTSGGLELNYTGGSGYVVAYNRASGVYNALNLDGSSVNFKSGAALVDNNGYMLCGYASSNGAYRLQVNSQIYATSATIATSDKRVKKNIKALGAATDLVLALRPVSYEFKKHKVHNFPAGQQIGFIAQEVAAALEGSGYADAIVTTNEDGEENLMGLAEAKVIPLLVKTIQELNDRIAALESAAGN